MPGIHGSGGRGRRCAAPGLGSSRQSSTAAVSVAVLSSRSVATLRNSVIGVEAVGAQEQEVGAQGRPRGLVGEPGTIWSAVVSSALDDVATDGRARRRRRGCRGSAGRPRRAGVGGRPVPGSGWWRTLGVVAGEDLLEDVGRGERVDQGRVDDAVRVAVADDLEVDVVGDRPRVSIV